MAILNKDAYEGKKEWAARRMADNASKGEAKGLTKEQAEALEFLCSARHNLHSNKKSAIMNGSGLDQIILANDKIIAAGLQVIDNVPTGYGEACFDDIDDFDTIHETEDCPEIDAADYQDWYDDTYNRINGQLEALNTIIEHYLAAVDAQFGTSYAPSGATRL